MKKISFLFLCVFLIFGCKDSDSKKSAAAVAALDSEDPYLKMFTEFMMIDGKSVFRGVNFDMTEDEVKKIEHSYETSRENSSEKMQELFFEVDLSEELLDFADIRYSFDEKGLFFINVESYLTSPEKSKSFYKNLESYFNSAYGKGEYADDGFLEFETTKNGKKIQAAIKEVNIAPTEKDKGSYGFYLLYSLPK